ncbi:hypothetical protein ACE1SV_59090 [Streptomyces sennicomposti]
MQGAGAFITRVVPVVSHARTAAMWRRHTNRILPRMDDQTALAYIERVQPASAAGPAATTDDPAAERKQADDTTESPP